MSGVQTRTVVRVGSTRRAFWYPPEISGRFPSVNGRPFWRGVQTGPGADPASDPDTPISPIFLSAVRINSPQADSRSTVPSGCDGRGSRGLAIDNGASCSTLKEPHGIAPLRRWSSLQRGEGRDRRAASPPRDPGVRAPSPLLILPPYDAERPHGISGRPSLGCQRSRRGDSPPPSRRARPGLPEPLPRSS